MFDVRWNPRNGRLGKDGAGDCSDVPRGGRGFSPGAVYTQVRAMHQMLGAGFVYAVPSHASDKFLINSMMTLLAFMLATLSNVSISRSSDGHAI